MKCIFCRYEDGVIRFNELTSKELDDVCKEIKINKKDIPKLKKNNEDHYVAAYGATHGEFYIVSNYITANRKKKNGKIEKLPIYACPKCRNLFITNLGFHQDPYDS